MGKKDSKTFSYQHEQYVVLNFTCGCLSDYLSLGGPLVQPGVLPKETGHPKRYAVQASFAVFTIFFLALVYLLNA
jgi:hypothetical protein